MFGWFFAVLYWISDTNNLTAISTAVIAFFTIVLAAASYFQARLIRKSIDLARAEFISTHRPRLRIRRIDLIQPVMPNERCRALLEIANIGETRATIFEFGIDIYGEGYPFNAVPQPYDIAIEAGKQANIGILGQILTEARIDAIELGTEELRTLGIVNYRDDNGVARSTSFARIYDRAKRRFVTVSADDPEADRDFEN